MSLGEQKAEMDRLREQYNKVLGAIDEGLVEDDATLAAASVTEMHAKVEWLQDRVEELLNIIEQLVTKLEE